MAPTARTATAERRRTRLGDGARLRHRRPAPPRVTSTGRRRRASTPKSNGAAVVTGTADRAGLVSGCALCARRAAAGGDRAAGARPPRSGPRPQPGAGVPATPGRRDGLRRRHDRLPGRWGRRHGRTGPGRLAGTRPGLVGPAPAVHARAGGGARAGRGTGDVRGVRGAAGRTAIERAGVGRARGRRGGRGPRRPGRPPVHARPAAGRCGPAAAGRPAAAVGPLDHPGRPAASLRHRLLRGPAAERAARRRAHHRGRRGDLVAPRNGVGRTGSAASCS